MFRVLITDNLSAAGLKLLQGTPEIEPVVLSGLSPDDLKRELANADGIIVRSATKLTDDVLAGQSRLKVIARAGVGVDNIDLAAATREGIVVMNTPAGNTTSTAEHTIAMMMALSRNVPQAAASMREGRWDRKLYTGTQLAGKTLAVVGLGRIGLSVAQRAIGLEMRVIGFDPFLSAQMAAEQGIELVTDVDELIPQCDFLTVHTPLTEETRGLINADRITRMKPGVRIINCARGGIVDEDALADALESGHVAGAALDVFTTEPPENPRLTQQPHLIATPHLGASTDEAQELVAVEAAEIIVGYLTRGEIRYAVNMVPISAAEMREVQPYLDLAHRLGLLLSQLHRGKGLKNARIHFRGDAANKNTNLMTAAFAAGLLEAALDENVNIVNATYLAKERGIEITESTSSATGDFATLISVGIETEEREYTAAGTIFGNQFLRLVRLMDYPMEAYLDGLLLLYKHRDVPGLIGFIGTVCGNHGINIASMALGRLQNESGGDSIAVLNVDNEPAPAVLAEIANHKEVTGVELVKLPAAGAPLPWLVSKSRNQPGEPRA